MKRGGETFKGRDFLTMQEFTSDEIWRILKASKAFKGGKVKRASLKGRSVALVFQKPSTRTSGRP